MRKLNLWAMLLIAVVAFVSCGQAEKKQIAEHVIYMEEIMGISFR